MNKEPRDINSNNNTSSPEYDNISRYYDPLFNIISLISVHYVLGTTIA